MSNQPSLFSDFPETEADLPIVPSSEREARVLVAQRNQIELRAVDLEATLGPEHPARDVWAFVERMDLSALYAEIGSVEGGPGHAAIDPKILMALWLYGGSWWKSVRRSCIGLKSLFRKMCRLKRWMPSTWLRW